MRHVSTGRLLALLLLVATPCLGQDQAPRSLGPSGLPLPRAASLASDTVNLRTGPGTEYPISWVYNRRSLPVKVLQEFDVWRKIADPDGVEGWAHSSLLTTRRTIMVRGGTPVALRRSADDSSRILLRAEAGVVGNFLDCADDYCRAEIDGTRGWVPRAAIWGLMDGE